MWFFNDLNLSFLNICVIIPNHNYILSYELGSSDFLSACIIIAENLDVHSPVRVQNFQDQKEKKENEREK